MKWFLLYLIVGSIFGLVFVNNHWDETEKALISYGVKVTWTTKITCMVLWFIFETVSYPMWLGMRGRRIFK